MTINNSRLDNSRSLTRKSFARVLPAAIAGLIAASWCTHASAEQFYAGASFVQTKFDLDRSVISDSALTRVDDEDQGYKIIFGWRPSRYFALEASYADLGAVGGDTQFVCVSVVGFPCPDRITADVETAQLAALGLLPLGNFDLFARVGVNGWRADTRITDGTAEIAREREDDTDLVYGVGAQYRYERLALRVEFEDLTLGDSSARTVSLGALYSF